MFVICFALPPHRPVNARRVWRYQIRIRISKENTQHNVLKKKYKRTNNDLQNIHVKLRIELHEPQKKSTVNADAPEGSAVITSVFVLYDIIP